METSKIQYKGIVRSIPQGDAADGTCQEIINARFKKGCWRPVGAKEYYRINNATVQIPENITEVYLHDIENGLVPSEPNWIGYDQTAGKVYHLDPTSTINPVLITSVTGEINIVFLKRTLIIASESGVSTFLYSDGKYTQVASLPTPDVDIAINSTASVLTEKVVLQDHKTLAASLLGLYYEALNNQSEQYGRLYGSFMYICAYRLFDGSYILHSVPRYFKIGIDGSVRFTNAEGAGNYSSQMLINFSGLNATINNELYDANLIGDTKDLVDSVCVFATRVTPLHKIDDTIINEAFMYKYIPGNQRNDVTVTKQFKDLFPVNNDFGKLAQSESWYKIHEFSFEDVVGKTGRTTQAIDMKGYYQDYATRETLTTDQFSHHDYSARAAYVYNDRLHLLNIKTKFGDPYIVWPDSNESLGVTASYPGKLSVYLKTSLGKTVVTTDVQVPAYQAAELVVSNPFPTYEQAEIYMDGLTGIVPDSAYIEARTTDQFLQIEEFYVNHKVCSGGDGYFILPEIVGYNDTRAYKIVLTVDAGSGQKLLFDKPLLKNSLMNFAYYHENVFISNPASETANYPLIKRLTSSVTVPFTVPASAGLPFDTNRLQVSEIQNPLIFPAKNSYQIGTGDGITICAGTEPLSTGQFGQFPLQVFTTKGIWALEIGSGDVLYQNVLPVAPEVVENRKNVISVGSGVVYSTLKGLFVIQGRESVQISEPIEGIPAIMPYISEIETLIAPDITNTHFTPTLSETESTVDFLNYIQGSKIGYDYDNRELIVTNSTYKYSYVYAFDSKTWHKIAMSFTKLINNYPKLLGKTTGSVIDISKESESQQIEVLFVSNVVTLENKDFFKKIERIVQRGSFSTDTGRVVGLYVFASDDLRTFQVLSGRQRQGVFVKDLLVQRSHGSAKYFVFVLNGKIGFNSEIKEIDIVFKKMWHNRLR